MPSFEGSLHGAHVLAAEPGQSSHVFRPHASLRSASASRVKARIGPHLQHAQHPGNVETPQSERSALFVATSRMPSKLFRRAHRPRPCRGKSSARWAVPPTWPICAPPLLKTLETTSWRGREGLFARHVDRDVLRAVAVS